MIARWFQLGGFGMIPTTVIGVIAVVVGVVGVIRPSAPRAAALRVLVTLVLISALIGMATGFTTMGLKLGDPAFLRAKGFSGDALTTVGFVGTGEAMVNLWWGGLLAFAATLLRLWLEVKLARARALPPSY